MAAKEIPKKIVDPYHRIIKFLRNYLCKSCENCIYVYVPWRKELVCWDCGMVLKIPIKK